MNPIVSDILSTTQQHLQPDLQMAARFLTLITQDDDNPSFVFQTFSDKRDGREFPQAVLKKSLSEPLRSFGELSAAPSVEALAEC